MARYRGPKLKIIRRLGKLPGLSKKLSRKKNPPGQHGRQVKKPSQYAIRLVEKQKLRFHYGLGERQLFNYLKKARKNIRPTTEVLVELLEMRLDNIIFRLGISPTINAAKQLISHCHICINNKRISISSYQCRIKDKITIVSKPYSNLLDNMDENCLPSFIQFNKEQKSFTIKQKIERSDVILELNELLVVEYYSKN